MIIHRVYNNNLASVIDERQNEIIIMGKGIAFQKKAGDEVDQTRIDKRFYMGYEEHEKFKQLLNEIPYSYIDLSVNIVDYARQTLQKPLSDTLYFSLCDHIYSTVQRLKEGIQLKNPMLWEIKRFYEPEYDCSLNILDMIKKACGAQFTEDEAGFIAIHLAEASLEITSTDQFSEITNIINDISNIVKHFFHIEYNTKSVYYYRFMSHIRFFAQRLITKELYTDDETELYDVLKNRYQSAYDCVMKIEEYTRKKYHIDISNDEKLYLMVHIERLVYKSNT